MHGDINEDFQRIDSDVDDEIDFDTNVKINPTFYIHMAILKAQAILANPGVVENINSYFIMVEHLESLALSANILPSNHEDEMKKKIGELEKDAVSKSNPKILMGRIANAKFKLITQEFFKSAPIKTKLEYSIRKKHAPNEAQHIPILDEDKLAEIAKKDEGGKKDNVGGKQD